MKKLYIKPSIDITSSLEESPLLAGTTTTEVIISGGGFDPVTGEPIEIGDDGGEPSGAKEWDMWDFDPWG